MATNHAQSCYHFLLLPSLSVSAPADLILAVPVWPGAQAGQTWGSMCPRHSSPDTLGCSPASCHIWMFWGAGHF